MKTVTQSILGVIWRILSGKEDECPVEDTAREFADLCSDASARLSGCRDLKDEGEVEKAVALAEAQPPLMEVMETLVI